MKQLKLKVQPVKLKSALNFWATEETLLARDAWVKGPQKPRDVLRSKEIPSQDCSLEALSKNGLIEILTPLTIQNTGDVEKIPHDVDLIVMSDTSDWFAEDFILEKIASLGKPIIAEWDNFGYSIHGRLSKFRLKEFSKVKHYITMGSDDLLNLLNAIRGWKFLRTMRVLYIGRFPSHSVVLGKEINFKYLNERFGVEFTQLSFDDYVKAVEEIKNEDIKDIMENWKKEFVIMDHREEKLEFYARIYKALKTLLERYKCNALTIDCAALPSIEYVPCVSFSLLIGEGIPCGCEADIPALFAMAMLMGTSEKPAMMGNLNENVIHADIEQNVIVLNHDVVPLSMACQGCKAKLRDFHATGKGLTPYVDLQKEMPVTIVGMHWDMNKIWATKGSVAETEDTTHCRISVKIKVKDAKLVSKEAFGHHIVMAYGDYLEALERLANLLEIEYITL
ncbi:MAG: L-arabinose isomerase family protein [Candidatus Bathyarchaeales archaeon]